MTGSGSGAPGRDVTADFAPGRVSIRQIALVLALGLVFRLIIAQVLPGSGFRQDLGAFQAWAGNLAAEGPFGFYERDFFHDYTPGYLYVLWLVGIVGSLVGGIGDLVKVPAILADVALGWLAWRMVLDLGGSERRATLAAAIVVVNPITWFDSVVWGQVDSFGVVFLLLAVRELWRGRSERAAVLAVIAALIKPQLGILAPIVAAVTIRRALVPDGAWGDEAPPSGGTGWERRTRGPVRILTTGLAGLLTAIAISAPFGLSVIAPSSTFPFVDSALLRQIFSTAAGYPYVTVNAYNAWALFPVDGLSHAATGGWFADAPLAEGGPYAAILGVPAVVVGAVALLGVMGLVSAAVARRPDRLTILVGLAVLAIAFFAVPTRVHERYSFPLFAVAAIIATISWRWRIAYVVASVATFLNMYVVLTTLYPDNPAIDDWLGIGPAIRSFWGVALVAALHTGVLAWILVQLRSGARRRLAAELAVAADEASEDPAPESVPAPRQAEPPQAPGAPAPGPGATAMTAAGAGADATPAVPLAGHRRLPAWFERPSWGDLGPVAWVRARASETPIRPDRSRDLAGERRGRLDRLDLWLLVVLVVASLFLRGFRLDEPTRMHFDEVYHARTAAEFLQSWRYDIDHSIYEWTHPHLAKYAMAAGIVVFGGHDVASAGDLALTVRDVALEPRRPDSAAIDARAGERLWVVTGDELVGYDLATRAVVARWTVPGARSVAFDADGPMLYVGTDGGETLSLDVVALDGLRGVSASSLPLAPRPLAPLGAPVQRLVAFDGGQAVAALLAGDTLAVVDTGTGEVLGRTSLPGATDLAAAGRGAAVVASPGDIGDPAAVAAQLADILAVDAGDLEPALRDPVRDTVVLPVPLTADARSSIQAAIDDGSLEGIQIDQRPWVAVASPGGVDFVSQAGTIAQSLPLERGAAGLALVSGVDDGTQLWVSTRDGATDEPEIAIVAISGDRANTGPNVYASVPLPGAGSRVAYDPSSEMVEVLGTTPDGVGPTVYVIEPHGRSVFADHRLPFEPVAWAMDTNPQYPAADRGTLLAFAAGGQAASLDVGHYALAWRLPGVLFGAATAGLLFLLARVLFRRREVGVLVGLFVLLDGMFFVQSRIAMNDVYTGTFILAAYVLFARLWLEPERPRWSFWALMPVVGLLLGLALASKWVAAYAIGALAILVLVRSALGRMLLVAGLIGMTSVLGWMAISVPADSGATGNLPFVLIMIGLTLVAVVVCVLRPIAWSDEEVRFAVAAPAALGIIVALTSIALGSAFAPVAVGPATFTPIAASLALLLLGAAAAAAFAIGGRLGLGPMAPRGPLGAGPALEPAAAAPGGWLRLGSGLGFPALWLAGSLLVVPLAVYVVSYLPWAQIEGHRIVEGFPAGHTGQTLLQLTGDMYRYHNELTAPHAASSPWWAWPLNLKPVWFYQGGFANSTAAAIYDAGNLVIWWLGVPAILFVAWQAYRRRSLALALIVIGFLAQWVSWARIDRAAFQYHYYTSLPFVVLALGYLVAEIWHGASRRTWLMARAAAAVALLGPVILWLLRYPLCSLANVEAVNAGSQACHGNPGNLEVTASAAAIVVVGLVTGTVLVRMLVDLGRPRVDGRPRTFADLVPLAATAAAGGTALFVARALPADEPLIRIPGIVPEIIALIVAIPLLLVAAQVLTARDGRRFVAGLVTAAGAWFLVLYPNIAALPLPSTVVNAYQGILPTYLYPFQFAVNQVSRGGAVSFSDPRFAMLIVAICVASAVVAYAAWVWRATPAADGASDGEGPSMEAGTTG